MLTLKKENLVKDWYPHVDPVVWLHPAVGAQRVLYVLHLIKRKKNSLYFSLYHKII